jgi:signal transduction histidine kinase/CheY-like chemotaxis protein
VETIVEIASYVGASVFIALTAVGIVRARRQPRAGRRAAIAFGTIAFILTLAIVLPEESDQPLWFGKLLIAVLLAFPYLLYRFTESFHSYPEAVRRIALGAVVLVAAATLFLPDVSDSASQPAWTYAYLPLVLVYWTGLSSITAWQLWRSGKGHPTVTRRRMRLMSVATIGLSVGLVVVGVADTDSATGDLVTYATVVVSGLTFLLGFSPPRLLQNAWRQPEQQAVDRAIGELMSATTVDEVAELLLPHVCNLVGASRVVVTDRDGNAVFSLEDDQPRPAGRKQTEVEVPLKTPGFASLVVGTSPYTPFFGRSDIATLRAFAVTADLAFERCRLVQSERETLAAAELARATAERANLAKSEFLSRMSHELRTPLNVILGFAQVLETSEISEDDQEAVGHMIKAGHHLLDLINEVLDLSRIEAGHLTISPEPVRADELLEDTLALIRPSADQRGIQIRTATLDEPIFVRADRQRLKQVLLNLLSNAVKYNRDRGVIALLFEERATALRITVRDTGPGLPEAYLDKLFEPFERLGAEQGLVEGTGLGLALSKQLIELMEGTLSVENFPGEGAAFSIELPVASAPADQVDEAPPVAADLGDHDGAVERKILLVEDNLANLHLIERILKRRPGIALIPAMQGTLGLDLAREHHPELILLDLHLPDLSGVEVLHRLRADPKTRELPVVIVSADASPGRVRRLIDAGADGYLTKPIDMDRFLETVDTFLERAQTPRYDDAIIVSARDGR